MPRKKELKFERYAHIPILSGGRLCKTLLGKRLVWTIKEDGENVTIWLKRHTSASKITRLLVDTKTNKKYDVMISSRNQELASTDIQNRVINTPEYSMIVFLLSENPTYRVVVEECRKGRSITGIKTYDRDQLFVIDIFDTVTMSYLPYTLMYQTCYHIGLQTVKLYSETRHRTITDLLKYKNHILEYCDSITDGKQKEEGMVVRAFDDDGAYLQAKVKLDIPEPVEEKIREGKVIYPQIPVGEIMTAISKVEADFGLTGKPKDDMPRIAKQVGQDCKEHMWSSRGNLFQYYQEYLDKVKNQ